MLSDYNQITNESSITTNTTTANGVQPSSDKVFEAEDIVADAIKLNVDEDLNEQRYVSKLI